MILPIILNLKKELKDKNLLIERELARLRAEKEGEVSRKSQKWLRERLTPMTWELAAKSELLLNSGKSGVTVV